MLFYLVEGMVAVISEERTKKKITVQVRRTRKQRLKDIEAGNIEDPDEVEGGVKFETDFPFDILSKGDFKKVSEG